MTKALISIDYSYDFVADDGKLTAGKPAQAIEDRIAQVTQEAYDNGDYIFVAMDRHDEGDTFHPETKLFPPHNIAGTSGRELYGKLAEVYDAIKDDSRVFWMDKRHYSAFSGTDLDIRLRERRVTTVVLTGVLTDICVLHTAIDACGKDAAKDKTVVRVGTMAKSESEQARWDKVEEILKKEGVTLKFSEFTDYSQPNVALNNGDIDINAFQHYNFLDNWNADHKTDLVPIAETYFTAFRVYSGTEGGKNKYKDIKELPEGATIAIPNDAVNESRALNLLQSAGLIKLSVGANDKAKLTDVSENSKNLNIREVDAAQTAANLDSVDAAIINNDFVTEAGIDPKTAIYVEPASKSTNQWYNLLVAQKGWEKSDKADAIKKVIKAYHTDEVKEVIKKSSQGLDEPVW